MALTYDAMSTVERDIAPQALDDFPPRHLPNMDSAKLRPGVQTLHTGYQMAMIY